MVSKHTSRLNIGLGMFDAKFLQKAFRRPAAGVLMPASIWKSWFGSSRDSSHVSDVYS